MNENIIILHQNNDYEAHGSLKSICRSKKFSYSYLKNKKFPFIYKGITFIKVPFNQYNGIL